MDVEQDKSIIHKHTGKSKLAQRFEGFDLDKYNRQMHGNREYDWGRDGGKEIFCRPPCLILYDKCFIR